MRFDQAKKKAIVQYLLEKINDRAPNIIKLVSETFAINQNTVHTYIKELMHDGVIKRVKRGTYELVAETVLYTFERSKNELLDEQVIYDENLRHHFRELPENVKGIWEYILGEMINNVIDHSDAEELCIAIKKDALITTVFIIDDGIGIFRKIKEHFGYRSLDDAICELFKGKLTTDPERHSGEGIFFSSKLADSFLILSDEKIFANNKYDREKLFDAPDQKDGTAVIIGLSNESNKMPGDIFEEFAQVDAGFSTTKIPLKNIFETAPVSRSQAKRVCQRLDKFREVILDFQGLDWMGQGFAHQIFVLFQKSHPEIALKPINMSKGVAQMYSHVTGREYE